MLSTPLNLSGEGITPTTTEHVLLQFAPLTPLVLNTGFHFRESESLGMLSLRGLFIYFCDRTFLGGTTGSPMGSSTFLLHYVAACRIYNKMSKSSNVNAHLVASEFLGEALCSVKHHDGEDGILLSP